MDMHIRKLSAWNDLPKNFTLTRMKMHEQNELGEEDYDYREFMSFMLFEFHADS